MLSQLNVALKRQILRLGKIQNLPIVLFSENLKFKNLEKLKVKG